MKVKDLRKKTDKQLIKMKKDLELNLIRASTLSGRDKIKQKDIGISGSVAKQGQKTSYQKNIKRSIAQINTILRERKNGNN